MNVNGLLLGVVAVENRFYVECCFCAVVRKNLASSFPMVVSRSISSGRENPFSPKRKSM
jgi:hypothetical protein